METKQGHIGQLVLVLHGGRAREIAGSCAWRCARALKPTHPTTVRVGEGKQWRGEASDPDQASITRLDLRESSKCDRVMSLAQ